MSESPETIRRGGGRARGKSQWDTLKRNKEIKVHCTILNKKQEGGVGVKRTVVAHWGGGTLLGLSRKKKGVS